MKRLLAHLLVASISVLTCSCRHARASLLERYFLSLHGECPGPVATPAISGFRNVFDAYGDGCGTRDTLFRVGSSHRINAASEAVHRAAFETGCVEQAMQYAVLAPDQLGVRGCGTRRVYISTSSGWTLNAETRDTEPAPIPPPSGQATIPAGYGYSP